MNDDRKFTAENVALDRTQQALRLASASVPHLSGLARLVRVKPTRAVGAAAISASGLLLVHPEVFAKIPLADAAFILAHELMHLALDTHGRQGSSDPLLVNFAHDYVINDILREELLREPPLDGLNLVGARNRSLEELVVELSQGNTGGMQCWNAAGAVRRGRQTRSAMNRALEDAGLVKPQAALSPPPPETKLGPGDLLPDEFEDRFEPGLSPEQRSKLRDQIRKAAAKAASLGEMREKMQAAAQADAQEPQRGSAMMKAVRDAYNPPWELAMQRWMDSLVPGERTYARPSRRGAQDSGFVRPGRRREGWTLHVLLDTSGSMVDVLPKALGAIAAFCDASNVGEVHLLQCDEELTADVWAELPQLAEFQVTGFGYSDMSPGMKHLAADPDVEAVLVLTDGWIEYPAEDPPYRVVWGLIGTICESFQPKYGEVIKLTHLSA